MDNKSNLVRILFVVFVIIGFYLINIFISDSYIANNIQDLTEFILALGTGVLLLQNGLKSKDRQFNTIFGFACIVWALGQLLWQVYFIVTKNNLPYPSAAEVSFIGAYLLMISSMKYISDEKKLNIPLLLTCALTFLLSTGLVIYYAEKAIVIKIYMILYLALVCYISYVAIITEGIKPLLRLGVIILAVADLFLIYQIAIDDSHMLLISDPLYVGAFVSFLLNNKKDYRGDV